MKYFILRSQLVPCLQFGQLLESGPYSLRYNKDNSLTFVKWDTEETPDCIVDLQKIHDMDRCSGPLSREDFDTVMAGEDWQEETSTIDET
tara:strand:- start:401 stop:670 length:270 start_codon:yes stop_codon:yes gene_type:complete